MKLLYTVTLISCIFCLGFVNIVSHNGIRSARAEIAATYQSPKSRVPAELIKILAGEFDGLISNYLLLEVGSFIGSNQTGSNQDYRNIHRTLELSMALDPYFQQTYIYAQGTLPWDAKMPGEAIDLLAISHSHRPWDHIPGQYMGFDYYYFFNDYDKASQIFLEAAKIEGAPVILPVLGARFALKSQRHEAALALLHEMLENKNLGDYERTELENRMKGIKGVVQIEKAIDRHKDEYGTFPDTLEQLVQYRLIPQLPINPYYGQYFYDKKSGQVAFDQIQ